MCEEGIYAMKHYKNGEPQQVLIDDQVHVWDGKYLFPAGEDHQFWLLYISKAWCKIHNGRFGGGKTHELLRDLTGAPSYEFPANDEDLWNKMIEASNKEYIMTTPFVEYPEEGKPND